MSQQKQTPLHVLIIGGGIAGLTLAAYIQKASSDPRSIRSLTSTVYEAYSLAEASDATGGFSIAPNGIAALAPLDLAEGIVRESGINEQMLFLTEKGRILGRWRIDKTEYEYPMVCIMRKDLQRLIREKLQSDLSKVEYGKKLVDVEELPDKVVAHFEDGSSAEGDILIGADGIHSQTRRKCFPKSPSPEFVGILGIGGGVIHDELPKNLPEYIHTSMSMTFGRKGFFGTFSMKDGNIGWWSNYGASSPFSQDELKDTSDVIPHALEMYEKTHFPAKELIQKSSLILKVNIFDIQTLPTWRTSNRILLIGDAAHAVSPNSGQGVSLAAEDASLLGLLLSRRSSSPNEIFEIFEAMRKARVEKIIAQGRRKKNNKVEVGIIGEWIRNTILRIVFGLFGVERGMGWQYRYRIDWEAESIDNYLKEYRK